MQQTLKEELTFSILSTLFMVVIMLSFNAFRLFGLHSQTLTVIITQFIPIALAAFLIAQLVVIHRTGHSLSLGESDHGVGVNIDNFETHDTRTLIDGVAFSIEPGIYLPEFGIREEINVYIDGGKAVVSTLRQDSIVLPKIKF